MALRIYISATDSVAITPMARPSRKLRRAGPGRFMICRRVLSSQRWGLSRIAIHSKKLPNGAYRYGATYGS